MKKQTKSNIKAHLIRSTFYVLLLLAVCVIPFALAQRTTTNQGVNSPKLAAKKMAEHPRSVVPAGRSRGSLVTNATSQQPNAAHPNRFSRAPALPRRAGATITGPDGVSCAYDLNVGTDTFVPGVDDIGNHTDDGTTFITLPFTVNLWGQNFTSANVGSNGELEFGTADASFSITCPTGRPVPTAMGPYWGDQCTGACFNTPCTGCGIFTTTTGTAPNRIFYIEYRTNYYGEAGQNQDLLDYEVALFENGSPPFEYIYQNIEAALVANDSELTVNQKQDDGCLTEFGCDTTGGQIPPVSSGMALIAAPVVGTPTPTPTATPTCPPGNPNGGAGAWTAQAPYPTTIVRYGFVQTATDFYVFGGVSDGTEVNNVNRYNLGTGTWTSLAPMPFTSEAPTCSLDATTGIVYCAQGDTGNGFASYNIATDTWTPLANTPTVDNYGSASGAFNGKVFLAGDQVGATTATWVYDIATDTWSSGAASPANFFLAGYQQVGQFLYVVGGFDANTIPTNNTTTWRLDMSSAPGTWETGPAFTQGRADFGLSYDPGTNKLYAMGGDLQGNGFFDSTNEVDELDVSGWPGGTWNPSPPDLPLPNRQANQAGFSGASQIWSVGGLDGSTFIFLDEVWSRTNGGCGPTPTPTPGCSPAPWQEVAPMPIDLYGAGGASDGTFYYAAGGYSFSQVPATQAVFNRFDPGANSWTSLPDMPQSAIETLAVYYPPTNVVYVFGGEDGDSGTNYNITRIYDIASNTWSTGANMPDVRSFAAGGYIPATGMIYIVAGYNTGDVTSSQNTTWQYDPVGDTWTDLTSTDPYPHAAGGFAYGVVNDKLYVAGGRDAALNIINDTYEFDPQAPAGSRYTQKADEPASFQNNVPGSAAAQGVLWVFGGGNPFANGSAEAKAGLSAPSSAHIISKDRSAFGFVKRMFGFGPKAPDTDSSGRFYNPSTDTWSNSPNMNETRAFSSGAAIGNNLIIAAGGYNGASTVASAETENVCAGGGTPTPTPTVTPTPSGSCPPQITESTSQEIVSGNSVSCNNGVGHADNSYFRAFNMNTFTGGAAYNITAVEFGIEQATSGTGTGQPVEVRLYANHGSPFPAGDWQSNMIADIPINVPDQSLTVFVQPATVTVPAGTLELVYELFTPNGENVGNLFFVGSNPDGQSADSYLEAADCGVTVPTPTQDIGFPNMMIVFNVDGNCGGGTPTPTPTVTPTPIITPTPTVTPTPIITPTPTVTPTPIITPTPTPRQSPTPRPRPTPHPRPTPP